MLQDSTLDNMEKICEVLKCKELMHLKKVAVQHYVTTQQCASMLQNQLLQIDTTSYILISWFAKHVVTDKGQKTYLQIASTKACTAILRLTRATQRPPTHLYACLSLSCSMMLKAYVITRSGCHLDGVLKV